MSFIKDVWQDPKYDSKAVLETLENSMETSVQF